MLDYFVWTDALPAASSDDLTEAVNGTRNAASAEAPQHSDRVALHRPVLRPRLRAVPPAGSPSD